ncbi:MAG: hypothetical protein IPJ78_04505 [Gemmatimonadetes bacterium]|nr:hypothetical protein [Gemmatimonadota bacterium]
MFTQLLNFELRYHARRVPFALVTLAVCGMALMLVQTGYGAESAHVNSPYAVMRASGLLSLWLLFSQTLLAASGVLRDDEYNMRELIFSRPMSRAVYVATRYLGVVLAGLLAMSLAISVLFLAPLMLPLEPDTLGAIRVAPYAQALFTLILPNLLLVSALLCAVGWRTRSSLATYVGGVAIFALYMTAAMLGDSPLMANSAPVSAQGLGRAALMDPFGLSAVFEQSRYWTLDDRNLRLVSLSGHYLYNRLIVLVVAALTIVMATRHLVLGAGSRRKRPRPDAPVAAAAAPTIPYSPVMPTGASHAHLLGAVGSSVRLELKQLFGARVVQALLLLFVFITAVETYTRLLNAEYGTRTLASSGEMVGAIPLRLFALLALVYFGAELVWRERAVRMDGLVDATPASNGAFVLSKLLALVLVPTALLALGLLVAAAVQLVGDGLPIDPWVYVSQFWFVGYPLALTALLVVAVQVLSGNRWVGMLLSVLLIALASAGPLVGLEHPLLRYASAPEMSFSEFDGYGAAATSFAVFMLYWTTVALLLTAMAWAVWPRGRRPAGRSRMDALLRSGAPVRRMTVVAGGLAAATGGAVFYQTNVRQVWESSDAHVAWRVDYERAYRRLSGTPQPSVSHVDIAVDFTPRARRADIRGALSVRNRTSSAIDTVWLTIRREARDVRVAVREGTQVHHDPRFGVRAFAFVSPLQPGDSTTIEYSFSIASDGIRADGYNPDVSSNGSYVTMLVAMPSFGYRASYELGESRERARRGLPPASAGLSPHVAIDSLTRVARAEAQPDAWLTLRATLSTTSGQTALGPGALVRSWKAADRSYFEYRVDDRMPARFGFASAEYAVRRDSADGVLVEFWHHPDHGRNAERFVDAATASLRIFSARFGRYPHKNLRLIEVPGRWPFAGFALSGMIMFNEGRGVLTDARVDDVDLLTRRVAHEVAHQWWGYAVSPLEVRGATTIVETLAKYSEQLAVEHTRGAAALPQLIAYDHDRYLSGRVWDAEPEPALVESSDQDYLYYGKGAVAMHALRGALGDSAVERALRTLLATEGGPQGAATAPQLHALLRSEAVTEGDRSLVDEWFTERVLYDLRVDSAWVEPRPDGYLLRAEFHAVRVRLTDGGERDEPAEGQRFDVAVRDGADSVLHRGSVVATRRGASLSMALSGMARSVEIDPWIRRIDRERSNNVRRVVLRQAHETGHR